MRSIPAGLRLLPAGLGLLLADPRALLTGLRLRPAGLGHPRAGLRLHSDLVSFLADFVLVARLAGRLANGLLASVVAAKNLADLIAVGFR